MTERTPSFALINQLKRERKDLWDKSVKARDEARTAKDETAETRAKLNAMLDDVEKYTARIDDEERALAAFDAAQDWQDATGRDAKPAEKKSEDYNRAFRSFLANGVADMPAEHRSILLSHEVDTRALGIASGAVGGYAVPEDFYKKVVEIMQAYGGMRRCGATVITTAGGNDLPVPIVSDDTGGTRNVGEIVAENGASNAADPTFSQMILKGYTYSSKMIRVHRSLLQDEAIDLESLISRMLGERIARITNTHFTTGDDNDKPEGFLNSAASSGVTTAKYTAITYAELVRLMHSVDPAYQVNGRWMFRDSVLSLLKQMVTATEGLPLWMPGVAAREPDMILGKPYVVNQDMPAFTNGLKGIAFGDFSDFFIRDVRGATLMRLTERYAEYNQVAFLLWTRHDSGLANPNAVKYATVGSAS